MSEASLGVPRLLLRAVAGHAGRMRLSILTPVVRVLLAPLPGTLPAFLRVDGIVGEFLSAVIGAPPFLAFRPATDPLIGMGTGRLEQLLAIRAAAWRRQRVVPPR